MYRLQVKLKQHTPLIHFQWQQEGATLRASEVKPKLDRFIISLLGDGEYNRGKNKLEHEHPGWAVFKDNGIALKYKLSVHPYSRKEGVQLQISRNNDKGVFEAKVNGREEFPFLLGNMGGKEEEKDLFNLCLYEGINLKFLCADGELGQCIEQNIAKFFAHTNFGQRNTKGFGSFTVTEINEESIPWKSKDYFPGGTRLMEFSLEGGRSDLDKQLKLFKTLDFYWKCLKSGINYTKREVEYGEIIRTHEERYIKAFLWTYLNRKDVPQNWEKRKIKQDFRLISPLPLHPPVSDDSHPAVFARALLGCPDKFEYKVPQGTIRNGREWKRNFTVEIRHDERNLDKIISRIPSPIYFKPVLTEGAQVKVYILIDPSIKEALRAQDNLRFKFVCSGHTSCLNIDINSIDYQDLIIEFHKYIGSDPETANSIYHNGELPDNQQRSFHFIARDFRWENILGRDRDGFDRLITLKKTQ